MQTRMDELPARERASGGVGEPTGRCLTRLTPVLVVFAVAIFALLPAVYAVPQNGDESQYAWTAAYYGGKLGRLDFDRTSGEPSWLYPGWDPLSIWALTQPMGTRLTYAVPLLLGGLEAPSRPYDYSRMDEPQPEASVPAATLPLLRYVSILCAALGLAFFTRRWGWWAVPACLGVLALPGVPEELAPARAEGQLLLGLGLCALAYRTRWFPVACAVAATFKLTALGLWPLLLIPASSGRWRRLPALGPVLVALGVWWLLTPTAWFLPPGTELVLMLWDRAVEFGFQSADHPKALGLYLPARYLLPLGYAAALAWVWAAPRLYALAAARLRRVARQASA